LVLIGEMRPGRLNEQLTVCGRSNCHCMRPKKPKRHGPYYHLSYVQQGNSTSQFIQKELVDAILALAPTVPADATMVFDPSFGLGWTDSRGWKSFFGTSAQDMPLKVRVYQSLVDSLVSRGKSPVFISVMYPDAPFYRAVEVESKELTADSGQ
ncbi:MAG: hypothetical protein Q7T89_16025, partial [Anaerolineales bacterium]|nr:hypothetical protein [Anaerolineales bacterium]